MFITIIVTRNFLTPIYYTLNQIVVHTLFHSLTQRSFGWNEQQNIFKNYFPQKYITPHINGVRLSRPLTNNNAQPSDFPPFQPSKTVHPRFFQISSAKLPLTLPSRVPKSSHRSHSHSCSCSCSCSSSRSRLSIARALVVGLSEDFAAVATIRPCYLPSSPSPNHRSVARSTKGPFGPVVTTCGRLQPPCFFFNYIITF